jgi:hypothetical protein
MLLQRLLDTPVRAFVYEASGAVDDALLAAGSDRVRLFCEDSRIPYALLWADPADHQQWLEAAAVAVDRLLGSR